MDLIIGLIAGGVIGHLYGARIIELIKSIRQ